MAISFDFSGKNVLITGGTKGIGRAIAENFLVANANVAVCARNKESYHQLKTAYPNSKLILLQADASKEEDVCDALKKVIDIYGSLDILINNVGGAIKFGNFSQLSSQDWMKAFKLNVMSMVYFSKHAIPYLKQSQSPKIVNISSISGVEPGAYNPHYTSTKASTINYSKYLGNFLAPDGILVNCVCPGTVETDSMEHAIEQIAKEQNLSKEVLKVKLMEEEIKKIPLKKLGQGKDIASFVLFLASDLVRWVTGSCFHINGGKMRGMC